MLVWEVEVDLSALGKGRELQRGKRRATGEIFLMYLWLREKAAVGFGEG